jgi:hypothetical protein
MTLAFGGIVAAFVLYALNPPWWTAPIAGVERFVSSNLNRGKTIPIPVLFLGRVYNTPNDSLPWYNTLVWTVFVTPVGFLGLALTGVVRALRRARSEPFGLLAVGHWAFLLSLRALPHTPGHDGVRQFLPAFGVLALVAGLGSASALERFGRWGKGLVAAALVEGAVSVALMMPVPLSYFSPVVGGLPGASALGMEPTYYWDALTDDALSWLRSHTGPGEKVRFATYPSSLLYLRDTGRLPAGLLPSEPGVWTWYVVQNRPGAFHTIDRALAAHGRPAFEVRKWGVPLLWVFPYDQIETVIGSPSTSRPGTPRPTTARSSRAGVGRVPSAWSRGARSITLAGRLGRRLRRRVVDGRGGINRGRGLARDRGRRAGLLVAAEQLVVAATGVVMEEAAMLGRARRRRTRFRRRTGRGRARRRTTPLLVTARAGVSGPEGAEDAGQSQGQQMPLHWESPKGPSATNRLINEPGQFVCPPHRSG